MKTQKGITLIALIITIIVMLILVGVSVTVALNTGLFKTAGEAAKNTQLARNEELAMSNGRVKIGNIWYDSLEDYIAGIRSEDQFDTEEERAEAATELELLRTYFLGEKDEETGERPGKSLAILITSPSLDQLLTANPSDIVFADDEDIGVLSEDLSVITATCEGEVVGENYENLVAFVKYKEGKTYKIVASLSTLNILSVDLLLEDSGEQVGKYVEYDNKLWVVLYDDDVNGLQMITANILEANNVYLGSADPTIVNAVNETEQNKDLNGDGKVENIRVHTTEGTVSSIEKAIYSYNNAIETLNKKCEGLVADKSKIETVRSVGSNPNNKNSENSTPYTSENLAIWPENSATYTAGIFNGKGKGEDQNYQSDYARMWDLGINVAQNSEEDMNDYWLASRRIHVRSGIIWFGVLFVHYDYQNLDGVTWGVSSAGSAILFTDPRCGVRPVVTLKSGIQLVGEGTKASPCTLQ